MRRPAGTSLRIAASLLALAGFLALASVRTYGAVVLAVPLLLLPLSPLAERLDARFPVYRAITWPLTLAYFFFVPFTVMTFGLLDAVVILVIFIQGYLLLHTKDVRQFHHLALMALFMLLAALVQAPEPVIGLVLVLFLISTVWMYIALGLHASGAAAPPLALAEAQAGASWRIALSIASLSVGTALLTVLFFIVTPRTEAGLLGREILPDRTRTGLPERVDLAGGGPVAQDTTAVMHVEFPDLPGGIYRGPMYWRTTTLNQYIGSEWTRRGLSDNLESAGPVPSARRRVGFPFGGGSDRITRFRIESKERVRQIIYIDDVPELGVPCLDLVQEIRLIAASRGARLRWDDALDFTVIFETVGTRRMTYEAWSEVGESDVAALRAASDDYEDALSGRDLQLLTAHNLLPETQALARRITAGAECVFDRAQMLQQWLSGPDFAYTLDLPVLPRDHAIDVFINQTRRGHCELFASALALMLRSLGIPTRLASGYRGGEYEEDSQSYTVRASDAHLWVEVFIVGHGWVVFDPSPRSEPGEIGQIEQFTRNLSRLSLEMKMFWYQEVIGYDRAMQLEQLREVTANIVGLFPAITRLLEPRNRGRILWAPTRFLMPLGFAAALAWAFFLLTRGKRSRQALTPDQARAARLYRSVLRRLRRCGMSTSGITAEELLAGWCARGDGETLRELVDAYNEARFGGRSLTRDRYLQLLRRARVLRA